MLAVGLYNVAVNILADSQGDILVEEVQKAVKKLKNNKSPGNDGITGEMIKRRTTLD